MAESVLHTGTRDLVKTSIYYKKVTGEASSFERSEEYQEFYVLSVTARSNGRIEDVQQSWNDFETGVTLKNVPEGFRLVFYDHPQMLEAGYSLLGPKPLFDISEPITLNFFKLTDAEQIDLPFAAVLVRIEKVYHFAINEEKAAGPVISKNKKGVRRTARRRHSSSEEEDQPRLNKSRTPTKSTKRW